MSSTANSSKLARSLGEGLQRLDSYAERLVDGRIMYRSHNNQKNLEEQSLKSDSGERENLLCTLPN